ncbi:MAG TPA: RHS repeat-associated core domain-containing protein, partial [Blastocatellia bacterium]|nr:RHS repeat-associated core domain-containing protein [Blastocatellia bacterium]
QGHLPFGEDFAESGTQEKHHFTSYERDGEIGTSYAVNRQHGQDVGRFQRPDPNRGSYSYSTPQTLNRYAYVGNDPINLADPLGLDWECETIFRWPSWNGETWSAPLPILRCFWNPTRQRPWPPATRRVIKNYHRKFRCNKKAEDVLKEIEKDFSKFGNTDQSFGGALTAKVTFGSAPIVTGATIPITTTVITPPIIIRGVDYAPPPFTMNTSVTVYNVNPISFTYVTNPGHPLYPGKISFSAEDKGENGKIKFSIDVDAQTNGRFNDTAFELVGSELEDKIWNHLIDNVEKFCKE